MRALVGGFVLLAVLIAPFVWVVTPGAAQARPADTVQARPLPGPPRALPVERAHAAEVSPSDPARVYSATSRGLFVSDNGGQSWAPLPVERTQEEVFSLALHPTDPGEVVVGRRDGLWQTRDGGKSWASLASPTVGPYVPLAVAIARSRPNVLYVATAREGVYRSADGGSRWTNASQGLPEATAGGRPAEIRTLVVDPRSADIAYIAHEQHGVYRTTDGGASWRLFNDGLPPLFGRRTYPPRLAFDPDHPDRLYLVFGQPIHSHLVRNRLYVISSGGEWSPVEAELPSNTPLVGLTVDRGARALNFWARDMVLGLPLPTLP